jgi:hypothetical protein
MLQNKTQGIRLGLILWSNLGNKNYTQHDMRLETWNVKTGSVKTV